MAKILLVEDDNNLREIYEARLTAEGYEIVSAPDGEEALAIAVKEKPALIITDVMMPKISGFDMLDILRNAPETKDTKVIMMTALSQAEDKERADKLGADLYLVKSQVTLEDVVASVKKIMGNETTAAPAAEEAKPVETPAPAEPTPPSPAPAQEEGTKEAQPPDSPPVAPSAPAAAASPTPPAPAPSTPVPEPPKSEAKKIEVTLPDSAGEEKPKADDKADDKSDEPSIGPNLAEALAEEEKTLVQTGDAKHPPASEPSGTLPSTVIKPQEAPATETPAPAPPTPAPSAPVSNSENPNTKVIQPLHDPTKDPDLQALLAKEEAKETGGNPPPPGGVEKPNQTPEHPDDFSKISL